LFPSRYATVAWPDLLGELGLHHVLEVHLAAPGTKGDEEGLVEQVLDHDGRVAERLVRDALPDRRLVELHVVLLAREEEVDQVAALGLGGHVEIEPAVEPTGPQERGVERVASVRGRDHEDVVVRRLRDPHLPVGR
jgi:hypothetical protein